MVWGQADRLLSIEVFRPASGIRQVFHHLPFDTRIRMREGRLKSSLKGTVPLTAGPTAEARGGPHVPD